MYDGLLETCFPEGVSIIGYADDIALLGCDKDWSRLEEKMTEALRIVINWMTANKLSIAPEKTEAVALKFSRRARQWEVTLLGQPIAITGNLKYLGIVLDSSVSFGPHIRRAATRAEAVAKALGRLMPNIGGPGEKKRRTLGAAVHSVLLYGAPVWAQAMGVASYRRSYQSVQRKLGLRISRAYRTASYDAVMVLALLIPIHLLVDERQKIWRSDLPKKEAATLEREVTLDKWQDEWERGSKGAWTRRLIPQIRPWLNREHGEVSYHLSQALTGHGAFRSYTFRIGKTEDGTCAQCDLEDTPEHTLFVCPRYGPDRDRVQEQLRVQITPENLIPTMLGSEAAWNLMTDMITGIMRDKEVQERDRRD